MSPKAFDRRRPPEWKLHFRHAMKMSINMGFMRTKQFALNVVRQ